jgi:hypothetical protein
MADIPERRPGLLNVRFVTLVGITLAAAATRLVPHPPNLTPVAALALFGGAYFSNRIAAFAVPLAAMLLSDLALGLIHYGTAIFSSMPFVYASLVLTVLLGLWVRRRRCSPVAIAGAALASSILFFIISNFGVWLQWNLYPKTLEGLAACYIAAIPFFRNTLAGDAVFTLVLFGGFALAQHYIAALREPAAVTSRS